MPQRRRRLPAVWLARRGRVGKGFSAGRRGVAVTGSGCPCEQDPGGGRDRWAGGDLQPGETQAGAVLGVPGNVFLQKNTV